MANETAIIDADIRPQESLRKLTELVNYQEGTGCHNYEGTAENMFVFTTICTGSTCNVGGDFVGEVIPVKWWYIHPVNYQDERGEITNGLRTVLITEDHKAFGFGSNFIAQDLLRAIEAYGKGPYDPPVRLRIAQQKTRKGHNMLRLEPEKLELVG